MRKRVFRSAVAASGGLVCRAAMPSAGSVSDFSIDTYVPGGSAWVAASPGDVDGILNQRAGA